MGWGYDGKWGRKEEGWLLDYLVKKKKWMRLVNHLTTEGIRPFLPVFPYQSFQLNHFHFTWTITILFWLPDSSLPPHHILSPYFPALPCYRLFLLPLSVLSSLPCLVPWLQNVRLNNNILAVSRPDGSYGSWEHVGWLGFSTLTTRDGTMEVTRRLYIQRCFSFDNMHVYDRRFLLIGSYFSLYLIHTYIHVYTCIHT